MSVRHRSTEPSPGDTSNVLLAKLLQLLGGYAEPGDTDHDLLVRLLTLFNSGGGGGGGGGQSQTPWLSNINGAGFNLTNVGALGAVSGTFSGAVGTGALTSTTGNFSGAVTGTTATFSGAVGTGALTSTTGTFSSNVGITGNLTISGRINGLRVYRALLTQSGTNAPVETELENSVNTGGWVWSRFDAGRYRITGASGTFPANKTFGFAKNAYEPGGSFGTGGFVLVDMVRISDTVMELQVYDNNTVGVDDMLNGTSIEILVYP